MKKRLTILCVLLAAATGLSRAQGTDNDLENDLGARVSLTADKRIVKGFHWTADGEARFGDNFSDFGRYQFGTGLTYKISSWLKVGAGYILIEDKNSSGEWNPRHRVYGDVTFSHKTGYWRFSVKERLQMTHRDVGNPYQKTPNLLTLKSRFKVSYDATPTLTPYGYIELRNVFNDPACSATWNTSTQKYSDYSFLGYTDTYFNRLRGAIGVDWKLNSAHSFDFFILSDYCRDKNIDTNKEGTKLKSLTYDKTLRINIGIGYTFSF
ncbi:MAG: DUF2490 domain-containing protein [Bacteroidales bacterium]|nr:DUF2490 domain-containing protein [Bacteroidales bacterium]